MASNPQTRMRQAARLFAQGATAQDVATILRARPETVARWRKDPFFREQFHLRKEDICADMQNRLWHMALAAFEDKAKKQDNNDFGVSLSKTYVTYHDSLEFFKSLLEEPVFSSKLSENAPDTLTHASQKGEKTP